MARWFEIDASVAAALAHCPCHDPAHVDPKTAAQSTCNFPVKSLVVLDVSNRWAIVHGREPKTAARIAPLWWERSWNAPFDANKLTSGAKATAEAEMVKLQTIAASKRREAEKCKQEEVVQDKLSLKQLHDLTLDLKPRMQSVRASISIKSHPKSAERSATVTELGTEMRAIRGTMGSGPSTVTSNGHEINVGGTVFRPKKGLEIVNIDFEKALSTLPAGAEGGHLSALREYRHGLQQQAPYGSKAWQSKPQERWVKVIKSCQSGSSKIDHDWELVEKDDSDEDYVFA